MAHLECTRQGNATPEGPVELAALLVQSEVPSRLAADDRLEEELADLVLDVAQVLDEITDPQLRKVCERLKDASVSKVARDLNVPRTTINTWLQKLRCQFEERGLKDCL